MKNPTRYFDNARLAVDLAISLGAKGTDSGTMSNFSKTPPEWECPACRRTKAKIARLNKNGDLYCSLHFHHDHTYDGIVKGLGLNEFCIEGRLGTALESLVRFPPSYICMDCNMADRRAARPLNVPQYFSFSPLEIGRFVCQKPNANHEIDHDMARKVFDEAVFHFEEILDSAAGTLYRVCPTDLENALGAVIGGDGFEQIGGAAWRVLKNVREKMKKDNPK